MHVSCTCNKTILHLFLHMLCGTNRNWWLRLIWQVVFRYVYMYTPGICNEFNDVFFWTCAHLMEQNAHKDMLKRVLSWTLMTCCAPEEITACTATIVTQFQWFLWDEMVFFKSHLEQINICYSIPRTHETCCRNQVVTNKICAKRYSLTWKFPYYHGLKLT